MQVRRYSRFECGCNEVLVPRYGRDLSVVVMKCKFQGTVDLTVVVMMC